MDLNLGTQKLTNIGKTYCFIKHTFAEKILLTIYVNFWSQWS